MDDRYTPAQIAAGEARMKTLLREFAELGIHGLPPAGTPAGDRRWIVSAPNLQALIIRPAGGGWIADVLLRKMPPGEPDLVVGTPEAQPCASRKEAIRIGRELVHALLAKAMASFFVGSRPVVVTY